MSLLKIRSHLSSFQVIMFGFSLLILAGAVVLMTPLASRDGTGTDFMTSLFTATSAVCVTGLVTVDTATHWSFFGQLIVIVLIQIGGLGIVMAGSVITILSGRRISLLQRATMKDALSAPHLGGIVRLTQFIVKTVIKIEAIGTALLALRFIPKYGFWTGLWYGVFHSVSAFCNAGFDLMGQEAQFSSLTAWKSDPIVSLTIAGLIVIGGIGFLTWYDIYQNGYHLSRYSMQSKLILIMTAILIGLPTLYFYCFEFTSYHGLTRFLISLFQAITPRTAGFNTVDLTKISETGRLLIIVLMLTGGAPGSTAGGMKTTTVGVLFLSAGAIFSRHVNATCCHRRIDDETRESAAAVMLMYLILFTAGGCLISAIEGLPLLTCLFEAASAVGTVGLTLGITPTLSIMSRVILILLMFIGRVGGMTLIYAILPMHPHAQANYVSEKVIVG